MFAWGVLVGTVAAAMAWPKRAKDPETVALPPPDAPPLEWPRPIGAALPAPTASTTAVDPTAPVVVPRTPEELVKAAVGRWRAEDGSVVEVDPPRPRIGARAPYHLVVAPKGKTGFGCDFTDAEVVKKKPDDSERTYRAWCGGDGKGKRAALGVTLDAGLSVSLMVDGEWRFTSVGMAKQAR